MEAIELEFIEKLKCVVFLLVIHYAAHSSVEFARKKTSMKNIGNQTNMQPIFLKDKN